MYRKIILLLAFSLTLTSAAFADSAGTLSPSKIHNLERSAQLGYGPAQYELGLAYAAGEGVPQNLSLAVFWWKKGAKNLDGAAQLELGTAYAHGWGVPKNMTKAIYWWTKAARDGNHEISSKARLYLDQAA